MKIPDEVSALVIDIGTSSTRCGYAGDDTPRSIFSTSYGYTSGNQAEGVNGELQGVRAITRYVGDHGPSVWRKNLEVASPLQDGLS